ncbi:MAG: AAA family ATPase [Candidatus Angelobacter sp.]
MFRGSLALGSITALAAPVGQRKSLIALNVAHALCTGEPLFGQFVIDRKPARVVYLCPEMGISSFSDRLKKIGLMPCVGKTLFCRTMSAEGLIDLDALAEELDGAVVIIDTAVRYLKGDENSSEHMRAFAESIFRLMRSGALSVLLLHHSAKGTKESLELTLENAMRGSGELGAFVSCCWATRLQDPTDPYQSASYITNVKQRDFESKPFEVTSGPDCRLHIVSPPGDAVLSRRQPGARSNRDGKEDEALAVIRDNPKASVRTLVAMLSDVGIKRSLAWVSGKRALGVHSYKERNNSEQYPHTTTS